MTANRPTKNCRVCNAPFAASAADYTVNCPAHRNRPNAAAAAARVAERPSYPANAPHPAVLPEANAAECRRKAWAWSKYAVAYPAQTDACRAESDRLRLLVATLPEPC